MFRFRRIDIENDKKMLLEFHCRINYDSETPYMRRLTYEEYRDKWFSTQQPKSYLSDLEKTMKESESIAEILEDGNAIAGYLWVRFTNVQDYSIKIAEIMDITVVGDYQRRGIGTMMLRHLEEVAKNRGASLLRSDTGIENTASRKLHKSFGFKPYRINYEKILQ